MNTLIVSAKGDATCTVDPWVGRYSSVDETPLH